MTDYNSIPINVNEPLYQDPALLRRLRQGLPEIDSNQEEEERLMSKRRLKGYEKAVIDSLPEDVPSNDTALIAMGLLPSSNKRSCCREKQR